MVKQNIHLYNKFAEFYDSLYSHKDYEKEAEFIRKIADKRKTLLDAGCGTGRFLEILKKDFDCYGFDNSKEFVKIATKRLKGKIFCANLENFKPKIKTDIITCIFGTINYLLNYKDIEKFIKNCHEALNSKGILVLDIGFAKQIIDKNSRDIPKLLVGGIGKRTVARITQAQTGYYASQNDICIINDLFLVKSKKKIDFEIDQQKYLLIDILKFKGVMKKRFAVKFYDYFNHREIKDINSIKNRIYVVGIRK